MLQFKVILMVVGCISLATADEETELLEKIYQMAQQVVNTTTELQQKNEVFEARKGFSPLHFLFPLCEYIFAFAFLRTPTSFPSRERSNIKFSWLNGIL